MRDSKIHVGINTNTEYLKIARKGGGHKGTNNNAII